MWEAKIPMKCVCVYVCVESSYTSFLHLTVMLKMLALIRGAGKCEVYVSPPLSSPPTPHHHLSKNNWQKEGSNVEALCQGASGFHSQLPA